MKEKNVYISAFKKESYKIEHCIMWIHESHHKLSFSYNSCYYSPICITVVKGHGKEKKRSWLKCKNEFLAIFCNEQMINIAIRTKASLSEITFLSWVVKVIENSLLPLLMWRKPQTVVN